MKGEKDDNEKKLRSLESKVYYEENKEKIQERRKRRRNAVNMLIKSAVVIEGIIKEKSALLSEMQDLEKELLGMEEALRELIEPDPKRKHDAKNSPGEE